MSAADIATVINLGETPCAIPLRDLGDLGVPTAPTTGTHGASPRGDLDSFWKRRGITATRCTTATPKHPWSA